MNKSFRPKNPKLTSSLFLLASVAFAIPTVLRLVSNEFNASRDLLAVFNTFIFAYLAWATRNGIQQDEFTRSVQAEGFRWGTVAMIFLGMISHVFFNDTSPAFYLATGVTYGALLIVVLSVLYSWWILRK